VPSVAKIFAILYPESYEKRGTIDEVSSSYHWALFFCDIVYIGNFYTHLQTALHRTVAYISRYYDCWMPVCSFSSITAVIQFLFIVSSAGSTPWSGQFPPNIFPPDTLPLDNHHHHHMGFLKWPKQQRHHEENRCQTFSPWDNNFPETLPTEIPASLHVSASWAAESIGCLFSQVYWFTKKQILIIRW